MPITSKAVFVHIPKTGGQAMSHLLGIAKGDVEAFYCVSEDCPGEKYVHSTIHHIRSQVDTSDKFVFTIVRNPYDRVLSEYNHRMRNLAVFHLPVRERTTFDKYCESLLMYNKYLSFFEHRAKAHILPQSAYIDDSVKIYKYEYYAQSCKDICKRLDLPYKAVTANSFDEPKPKHTPRTREIVREVYREDFENFNYKL